PFTDHRRTRIPWMTAFLLAPALLLAVRTAWAHEIRPAYLELRERDTETMNVLWKVPAREGNVRLDIHVRFPPDAKQVGETRETFAGDAMAERRTMKRPVGWSGAAIHFDGLDVAGSDVLVRIERLAGSTQTTRVFPIKPEFSIEALPVATRVAGTYLRLGIEHILLGTDHLLFVLALLIVVKGWRRLVGTITAFTVAHSLTLAAATLGWVHVPGPPVEACIALSIVFVAAEILRCRQGQQGLTGLQPWLVAFTFGLLHGLGFAGALSEVGLPEQAIPV